MDISTIVNVVTMQRHRCYAYLLMSVFVIMNISNPRHRMYYDDYSMNMFNIVTALMVQLGTSCSFDSPGLARNEPTPGEHPQGDSTP
ncbi:tetrahydrofolate synthase [Segatella salivae]|uniref:tetrahydrofolate synthase n=1 Tax=Segatella salivae TaxID=228604 RepID=UPI00352FE9F9